jgi:glutamyl-tRNA reductase
LVCAALESSKQIKNETSISDGKTSVAYAVINLLNELANTTTPMRICLMGLGKIGTLTLKNFKLYLPQHSITIINRSDIKAESLAKELGVDYTPYAQRQQVLACTDVLVVATGADSYVVTKQDVQHTPVKLIFDLAVPTNVHPGVTETGNIQLYNIDQLSVIANHAIEARKSQLPLAEKIIAGHILKLKQWEMRRNMYITKTLNSSQHNTGYLSKVA